MWSQVDNVTVNTGIAYSKMLWATFDDSQRFKLSQNTTYFSHTDHRNTTKYVVALCCTKTHRIQSKIIAMFAFGFHCVTWFVHSTVLVNQSKYSHKSHVEHDRIIGKSLKKLWIATRDAFEFILTTGGNNNV